MQLVTNNYSGNCLPSSLTVLIKLMCCSCNVFYSCLRSAKNTLAYVLVLQKIEYVRYVSLSLACRTASREGLNVSNVFWRQVERSWIFARQLRWAFDSLNPCGWLIHHRQNWHTSAHAIKFMIRVNRATCTQWSKTGRRLVHEGRLKMQDQKMEDQKRWKNWKCRIENEGPNVRGGKCRTWKCRTKTSGPENRGPTAGSWLWNLISRHLW